MSHLLSPKELLAYTAEKGKIKTELPILSMILLGFLGGAFISLGYLAYLRVVATMPAELEGLSTFLGAAVFPIGLLAILLGGGELITGNMMVVPVARFANKINTWAWVRNWLWISVMNLLGAMAVAYAFGHYLGLTEGAYLAKTIATAEHKIHVSFGQAVVSGIGCNWLVCLAVWLCYLANDMAGKILGIWFPIMIFVLIGFQHVVANMFVIPAAIWGGADITWGQFVWNMISVWIGNAIGGAVFVGGIYFLAYQHNQ